MRGDSGGEHGVSRGWFHTVECMFRSYTACLCRSLRHWASGAAFHTQMMVHLACFEGQVEPLAARAALEQYKDDLTQIIPAYR